MALSHDHGSGGTAPLWASPGRLPASGSAARWAHKAAPDPTRPTGRCDGAAASLISPALEQLQDLPVGDRALLAGQCPGLLRCLALVPDPRDPRGVRHTLTSLLLTVTAVLAGARSLGSAAHPLAVSDI